MPSIYTLVCGLCEYAGYGWIVRKSVGYPIKITVSYLVRMSDRRLCMLELFSVLISAYTYEHIDQLTEQIGLTLDELTQIHTPLT